MSFAVALLKFTAGLFAAAALIGYTLLCLAFSLACMVAIVLAPVGFASLATIPLVWLGLFVYLGLRSRPTRIVHVHHQLTR